MSSVFDVLEDIKIKQLKEDFLFIDEPLNINLKSWFKVGSPTWERVRDYEEDISKGWDEELEGFNPDIYKSIIEADHEIIKDYMSYYDQDSYDEGDK